MTSSMPISSDYETKLRRVHEAAMEEAFRLWQTEQTTQTSPDLPFLEWATEHHRTFKNHALRFGDTPWLDVLYHENSSSLVIKKCAQIGVTEYLIARAFYLAAPGRAGLYVMPIEQAMYTFVANRVNRTIQYSSHYSALLKKASGTDSTALKHIGAGGLKFVGSNSPASFIEYPADFVIIDEYDRCDQDNIQLAYDRLKATFTDRQLFVAEVSTPTFPDKGIDAQFKASDGHEYYVPCPYCHVDQTLSWVGNVIIEQKSGIGILIDGKRAETKAEPRLACKACLTLWEDRVSVLAMGQFRAARPEIPIRGYHFSRLLDVRTSIRSLWGSYEKALGNATKMQVFFNSDMGEAYRPEGSGLSEADLNNCRAQYRMPTSLTATGDWAYEGLVTAGVDVGNQLHVRISYYIDDVRMAAFIGTVREFKDIPPLFERYNVQAAVIDLNPERRKVRELQDKLPYLFACQFVNSRGNRNAQDLKVDRAARLVTAERTVMMDELVALYRLRKTLLPLDAQTLCHGQFYKHMITPIRMEKEVHGQAYGVWTERDSGRDDFFLCDLYDRIAYLINPQPRIRLL